MAARTEAGAPVRASVLIAATTAAGAAVLAAAPTQLRHASLAVLALFAVAAVFAELIEVDARDDALDPTASHGFSFSIGVHLAAAVVLGPWAAAVVAAIGVVVADGLVSPLRRTAFNAATFALAAFAGGHAFDALGGEPGAFALPEDIPAALGFAATAYAINLVLVGAIISFTAGAAFWPLAVEKARGLVAAWLGEAALGVALAVFALREPWAVVALVPLVVALYFAEARLAALRTQTARALETFANVVDERDPYTYRHSARVAEYVRSLGERLELPSSTVSRLAWAGRLHDLGKIAVDAAALRKPGKLDHEEWAAMRRHPRLSARLLRGFRFAADEARAIEYHHERADGRGYYGVDPREVPLASHFLIVADTYDAMTSDRPYRGALSPEEALAEIENGIGTQFHPAVARAFVAMQRGQDPAAALTDAERQELRRRTFRDRRRPVDVRRLMGSASSLAPTVGAVAALAAVGFDRPVLALAGAAVAVFGVCRRVVQQSRTTRQAERLRAVAELCGPPAEMLAGLGGVLAAVCEPRWAALVRWTEAELTGEMAAQWGDPSWAPPEAELAAWLIRRAQDDEELIVAGGAELGRSGTWVALALRQGTAVVGYLVLAVSRTPGEHVEVALRSCADEFARALGVEPTVVALPQLAAAS